MDGAPDNGSSFPANVSICPNGTQWIWILLEECTMDARDQASVYIGLLSILCFMMSSLPQFYTACKTGKMDKAISIWFILAWATGDTLNLLGACLANQLPLQKYTSVYYIFADAVMLCFYFYFKCRKQTPTLYTSINAVCGFVLLGSILALSPPRGPGPNLLVSGDVIQSRRLLSIGLNEEYSVKEKIGFAVGLMSTLFYLVARLPQIFTNFKRKSTEGLAVSLFLLVILGNLTYGASILLKNPDYGQSEGSYVLHHLPWLTGSLGAVFLDIIILGQFFKYRGRIADTVGREPLLDSTDDEFA
ncbi:hypothetical protein GDO86_020160 [Hymenochirus boettgeri]|uniref:Lysosomal amino acid transporter 1 homolog n=1 Tax=Hymenochirus boettgeri TaxID=247094 RepID=A0A8T2IFM7_9PIPI|nr:hypothetical protein GDO86_020160 [Hymenochirus boettgeri]